MERSASGTDEGGARLRTYLSGFALALVLTVVPFSAVAFAWLPTSATLWLVAAAAVVQILVHLRYFLHLGTSSEQRWNTVSMAFSALIVFALVAGTIWLFYSLHYRTMAGP